MLHKLIKFDAPCRDYYCSLVLAKKAQKVFLGVGTICGRDGHGYIVVVESC